MSQSLYGVDKSFISATTLTAYRLVYLSAANTVAYPNTATARIIGITQGEAAETGSAISVRLFGTSKVYTNDTCSAGELIGFSAVGGTGTGYAATANCAYATGTTGTLVGVALQASAATGTLIEVTVMPNYVTQD